MLQKRNYKSTHFAIYKILLLVLLLVQSFMGNAQKSVKDSLIDRMRAYKASTDFKSDTLYIDLLYELGLESAIYDIDSLKILANETISLSQSLKYRKGEVQGFMNLGSYYSEIGDHKKAIENFKIALNTAKEIQHFDYWFRSKNLLAIEYEYSDDLAKALREYLEGIELAKKSNNLSYLSTFYVNASNLYSDQREFDQSIHLLNLAKENNKNVNDNRVKGLTLANLAASYIEVNDFKTAEEYTNECIAIFENLGLEFWQMYTYELKATIFLKQNQPSRALQWFQKSEKIHESIDQIRYKIPLYNGIAKAYFDLNNFTKSEAYAKKALVISKKINLLDERDISLKLLYEIKKNENETKEALAYLEELKTLSDTLNKYKNEKELRVLKSNLEFDQEKERLITANNKKVAEQKLYFYFALFIIITFSIIILILKRNNRIQDNLNQTLIAKTVALEIKEADLKKSNTTKSKLFSIIAHDLRGPINSFKLMFDLYRSGGLSVSEFATFIPKMGKDVDSISFTLNNLLSWGQTQMNGITTVAQNIDMHTIVENVIALLSKIAEQKSITIKNNITVETLIWADKNHIDIVVRNLISNALKFTPDNGIISVGVIDRATDFEFYVKDTGLGMSAESIEKVFNKGENYTTYGTHNEKGTGLGLLLTKEMLEKNNGSIRVESELNQGSCFYFTLSKVSNEVIKEEIIS